MYLNRINYILVIDQFFVSQGFQPNYADAYNNRGFARYRSGDKQVAIADYNRALQINPNYAEAYNNWGLARSELGDKQGAIAGQTHLKYENLITTMVSATDPESYFLIKILTQ